MSNFLDKFYKIRTYDDMKKFLFMVGSFHDGVLKEIHILNSAFVDDNLSMLYNFKYDMRLLIQRQWEKPSAVEIILANVVDMKLQQPECIWSASGEVSFNKVDSHKMIKLELDNNYFVSSDLYWRDASDWMGKDSRFGEYLSIESLHSYEDLKNGWVMCNNCGEAWQPGNKSVIQCPKCSGLNHNGISRKPIILE